MNLISRIRYLVILVVLSVPLNGLANTDSLFYVNLKAANKFERTKIVNMGVSIEAIRSDSVHGLVSKTILEKLKKSDIKILESFTVDGPVAVQDFPSNDSRFHNYDEMTQALEKIVSEHKDMMKLFSIGKTLENREIWAVQINTSKAARSADGVGSFPAKPGVVFFGNHHAREHVSAELPLMVLEYLGNQYGKDANITAMLDSRDVYIFPMVNPDGVEYDIADTDRGGKYKWQRKNMRRNADGSIGVDLNRNYGYKWGTGGSSTDPSSEVYMGPAAFSEPETQAVKAFVESRPNLTILVSFHTFSELILYPWGSTYDPISNGDDLNTYKAMAEKMASWNHYTPQQSSDLYIASGDTTDWSYGELGIFSFTFELSPKSMWNGGFYPGAGALDKVFDDNLKPVLYLIDLADNPHRAKQGFDVGTSWLN